MLRCWGSKGDKQEAGRTRQVPGEDFVKVDRFSRLMKLDAFPRSHPQYLDLSPVSLLARNKQAAFH